MTYRRVGEPNFNGSSLPFYSVDAEKRAEELIVMACALVPYDHPLLPGKPWYKLEDFGGELEDMAMATEKFKSLDDLG